MPPIKFKLANNSKEHVIRLALFDEQPSWASLTARISSIFEIPVGDVRVTYEDGDEVTIATNQELQDYYQTLPPMLTNPIRFTVKDASIIRVSQRRTSQEQFGLEDDWQRVSHLSPHAFTIPRPQSRESGAYVETVDTEEELPEVLSEGPRFEAVDDDGESANSEDSIMNNDGPDKQPIHVLDFDGEPTLKQPAQPRLTPSAVSYASSPPTVPRRPRSRSLSSSSHEGNTRRPLGISRSSTPELTVAPYHSGEPERPPTRSTVLLDNKGSAINTPEAWESRQLFPEERPSSRRSRSRSPNPHKQSHRLSASPLINFNTPSLPPMILEVHPGEQRESILINFSPVLPRSPALYPVENVEGIPFGSTPGEVQENEGGIPDPASATVSPRSQPRVNIKVVDDPPLPTIPSEPGIDPSNASPEAGATVASLTHDVAQLLNSLTEAFAAHPGLSAGLRNIIRNASQGAYWSTGQATQQQYGNSGQKAAEEAGRRVAEALGGVFKALGGAIGEGILPSTEINPPKHGADMGVRVEVRRGEVSGSPQPQQTFANIAVEKAPAPASSAGISAGRSYSSSSASTRTASPGPYVERRSRSVSPSERYPRRQPSKNTTPGGRPYHPPGVSIHRPGGVRQFIPLDGPDANIGVDIGAMWQSPRPDMRFNSPVAHPMFGYYRRPEDPWGPHAGYWGGGKSAPRRSATVPLRMEVGPGSDFIGGFVPPTHVHPYVPRPSAAEVPSALGGSGVGMTGTSVTMSSVLPSSGVEMSAAGEGEMPPRPPRPPRPVHAPVQAQPPAEESRRDGRPPSYEPAVAPGGTNASLMGLRDELEGAKKTYKEKKDAWRRQREAHKLEREIKEKQRAERRAVDYELRERQNAELQAFGIPIDPNVNGNATASPRPHRSGGQLLSHITESPLSRGSEIYTGSQPPPVPPKRNEPVKTSSPPRPVPMSSAVVEKMKVAVMNRLKDMGVESSSYPSVEALVDQDIVKYQQEEAMMGRVLVQEHVDKVVRSVLDDLFVTPVTGNATAGPSRSGKTRVRRA